MDDALHQNDLTSSRGVHVSGVNRPPAANQNWAFMPDCDFTSWHPKWKRFSHIGGCRKRKANPSHPIKRLRWECRPAPPPLASSHFYYCSVSLRTSDAFITLWAAWWFLAAHRLLITETSAGVINTTQITASASHPRRLHTRTCALKQGRELTLSLTHTQQNTHIAFPLIC